MTAELRLNDVNGLVVVLHPYYDIEDGLELLFVGLELELADGSEDGLGVWGVGELMLGFVIV